MSSRVAVTVDRGVAEVRFMRADKRNALDGEQFLAIAAVGEQVAATPGVRAVVLCGDGESFCAGLDFSIFAGMLDGSASGAGVGAAGPNPDGNPGRLTDSGITHLAQQVCWVWQELPMPVIAAVHGHALGGGCQIALGADIRLTTASAQWSVREVHWGLIPDMTGTLTLSRLVRNDVARELVYTARVIDGVTAASLGLATRVVDDPIAAAHELAAEIAARSPHAVQGAKSLFRGLFAEGAAEQFAHERAVISALIGSPNQVEATTANVERRPPNFSN